MTKKCLIHRISVTMVACRLGVTSRTLCRCMAEGKLPDVHDAGNSRVFQVSDLDRLTSKRDRHKVVGCAGVFFIRQQAEGELAQQVAQPWNFVGGDVLACTDVASGLSDRRADLRSALATCMDPDVSRLVVEHPDQLARFGTGLIAHLLTGRGVTVTCTGQAEDESKRLRTAVTAEVRGSDAA